MKKYWFILSLLACMSGRAQTSDFTLGADISWYSQLADNGYKFADGNTEMTCPELLKAYGLSAARFRVWVNPTGKYNTTSDVVTKAKAAKEAGLDVLIDFHLSSTWADPSNQKIPTAWASDNLSQMKEHVAAHVTEVLSALKTEGVEPSWVQIGNETNDGLLWEMGRASKYPAQYAALIAAGSKAVRTTCPEAKVIVHVSNGHDQGLFDWNLGILKSNAVDYDIIGMSLYPGNDTSTSSTISKTLANITHLRSTLGKPTMIVEVGLPVNAGSTGKTIILNLLSDARNLPKEACLGVFYWEPEAYPGWNGYQLGAASVSGKVIRFTAVMEAFREHAQTVGIHSVSATSHKHQAYDITGRPMGRAKGIRIVNGRKTLVN